MELVSKEKDGKLTINIKINSTSQGGSIFETKQYKLVILLKYLDTPEILEEFKNGEYSSITLGYMELFYDHEMEEYKIVPNTIFPQYDNVFLTYQNGQSLLDTLIYHSV
jgi:hypothetical protein